MELDISLYQVTDSAVHQWAPVLATRLTLLDVSTSTALTDASVLVLVQHCSRHLRTVKLGKSPGISESALVQLAQHCRKLQHLRVSTGCMSAQSAAALSQRHADRLYPLTIFLD